MCINLYFYFGTVPKRPIFALSRREANAVDLTIFEVQKAGLN
jgi:hypothetical protein